MFRFPFTNFHELNLDWILSVVKEAKTVFDTGRTDIDHAVETAEQALEVAEQAASGVIGDGAVTTPKLADQAVTAPKIFNNSVITSKIANGAVTLEKLDDNVINMFGSNFAVPTRPWTEVHNQSEFETYLSQFNKGEVSYNCIFKSPGTYKVKLPTSSERVVFSSVQIHFRADVDNVVLDLNGCLFYTSHLNFDGLTKSLGGPYTFDIVNSNTTESYFEGCTILFTYCNIKHRYRAWSCHSTFSTCTFFNSPYNISSFDTACDIIQGFAHFNSVYFNIDYSAITTEEFALFGIGNSPKLSFTGRTGVREVTSDRTNIYFFRGRQQANIFEMFIGSSFYNIDRNGSYDADTRRGYAKVMTSPMMGVIAYFRNSESVFQFSNMFAPNTTYKGIQATVSDQTIT